MGDGAGGLGAPSAVFAKFLQNLPFLPQFLAFPAPHVPVSPLTLCIQQIMKDISETYSELETKYFEGNSPSYRFLTCTEKQ